MCTWRALSGCLKSGVDWKVSDSPIQQLRTSYSGEQNPDQSIRPNTNENTSLFVAAVDEKFPESDLEKEVIRPAWFYECLKNEEFDSPLSDPIDLQAHGVAPEYADLMLNIRMLARNFQTANDCSSAQEYQGVLTFLCSTLQRLLQLPAPEPDSDYKGVITAACRHALIIHVFAQWCGHQPDPSLIVSTAQSNLLCSLRRLSEHRVSNRLLLWLLAVGGTCPYGPAQHKWFISQLADTIDDLGIRSWEEMKESLKQVIWHEYQDEKQHNELWNQVLALREEETL